MADLALIGPLDMDLPAIPLVAGGSLDIGSDVYLIGYPAEVDKFPQPTITNGILSRVRKWEPLDYTFFQVDATITGGQSGGILVTYEGDVIGISTFYYAGFGLASSVADASARLNAMLAGTPSAELMNRPFHAVEGATEHEGILHNEWEQRTYILREAVGTEVELIVEGDGSPNFYVTDLYGGYVGGSEPEDETSATLAFTVEEETLYVIQVSQQAKEENGFVLTSSHPLMAHEDPDDGRELVIGETIVGGLDAPDDSDYFEIELKKDEVVQISVDALGIDTGVSVHYRSDTYEEQAFDDDGGGGIFGQSAQITYKAPRDGRYTVWVEDQGYSGSVGGYFLTSSRAPATAKIAEPYESEHFVFSPYGRMGWYESSDYDFKIHYPADWEALPGYRCGQGVAACYATGAGVFLILEEDLAQMPEKNLDLADYVDIMESMLEFNIPGYEALGRHKVKTMQNQSAEILTFNTQAGRFKAKRFIYVDTKKQIAFHAAFAGPPAMVDTAEPMIDYLFESFRYWNDKTADSFAVYYLDEGTQLLADKEFDAALEAFSTAIDKDPKLVDAYAHRAWLYNRLGDTDKAIADMAQAVELQPDDSALHHQFSQIYWWNHDYENALAEIDEAIRLDDKAPNPHNTRALINASLGQYEEALEDVKHYARANQNELTPSLLDTRGYIYIKMGRFSLARADYDKIFKQNMRFPYALLGGGISLYELGDLEAARLLIEEGLAEVPDEESHDPQMTELLERAKAALEQMGSQE
ncbi:MAG: tetratricopeptide repeat protein [Caldilineaceae bacterium]